MSAPSTPRRLTPLNGSSRRSEPPRVAGRNLSGSRAGSSRDLQAEELRAAIVPPIISARNALAGLHTIEFPDSDINDEFTNDDGGSQQDSGKGPGNQGMHGATTETPLEVVRHAIRARKVASRKKMPRPGLAAGARRARNNAATPTQSSAKASSSSRSRPGSAQFSRRQARPTTLEAGETSPSDRRRVLRSRDLDSAGGMRQRPSTAPALRNNVTAVANTPVEQQEPPPGAHDKGIRAFERMISPGERHKITTVGFERPRSFVELQSQRSPLHRPGHGHRMHSQELEQYHDLPQASGGQRRGFGGGNSSNLSDDEFDDFHLVVARPNSIPYASNSPGAHPDVTSPAWEESEKLPMDFGPPPPQRVVYASNIDPWDARCQRAVSRKDQIRSDKVRHIEELLDYKMNRQARWDEKRRVEHGQKMLLASVYFSARQHIFKVGLRMGRINSHKKRKFVMQRKAAVIIQRWYGRRRMAKRLKDSERQMAALQRFIIRWQNMYRLSRKNASQEVLSKWLQEAFTQGFVIRAFMKFTRRIYLIQKFTIAFIVCRRARLELLELALQKVEAERMQDLDAMKKVNELAALEHMAHTGDAQFTILTRKLLSKSKQIKTVLGLRGVADDIDAAAGSGPVKKRLIPKKNKYGEPSRHMALDRALVQQRKRHIANDDLNHAKAVQKATNVDEEDAKRMLNKTHRYFINPELLDRMPKGNRSSLFMLLTKGGLEQLHEEVVNYQEQELRGRSIKKVKSRQI